MLPLFKIVGHEWRGFSTSVISEAMKRDTEWTTQIYLDSFANEILDDANENLLK